MIKRLQRVQNLAPGDFKVVRNRYYFQSQKFIRHDLLIAALEAEASLKNIAESDRVIGF